jgi:hypothetical protein
MLNLDGSTADGGIAIPNWPGLVAAGWNSAPGSVGAGQDLLAAVAQGLGIQNPVWQGAAGAVEASQQGEEALQPSAAAPEQGGHVGHKRQRQESRAVAAVQGPKRADEADSGEWGLEGNTGQLEFCALTVRIKKFFCIQNMPLVCSISSGKRRRPFVGM